MKKFLKTIIFDFFYLVIGAYVLAIFLENYKPGIISNHIDLNKAFYVLIPLTILCALSSSWGGSNSKK